MANSCARIPLDSLVSRVIWFKPNFRISANNLRSSDTEMPSMHESSSRLPPSSADSSSLEMRWRFGGGAGPLGSNRGSCGNPMGTLAGIESCVYCARTKKFALSIERKKMQSHRRRTRLSQAEVLQRETELCVALQAVGLVMRPESRLAAGYIHGDLDSNWTLELVVSTSCRAHYLYNFTPYVQEVQRILPEAAAAINHYVMDWAATWEFVRASVTPRVKQQVLAQFPYPAEGKWPWLLQQGKITEQPEPIAPVLATTVPVPVAAETTIAVEQATPVLEEGNAWSRPPSKLWEQANLPVPTVIWEAKAEPEVAKAKRKRGKRGGRNRNTQTCAD